MIRHALAAAVLGALILPAAADAKPSCTRGGASLEAAGGNVRVVRRHLKPESATRRDAIAVCWAPTGKRRRMVLEQDFGDDLRSSTHVEILDERYVGLVETGIGGVSIGVGAYVYDARKLKRVHSSTHACRNDDDDFHGPDDVAFTPSGGMAFTCGPLFLFRNAKQRSATVLEPASAGARQLGVSHLADGFFDRLYWTLADGTVKALDVEG
jgi:hypothetical protein